FLLSASFEFQVRRWQSMGMCDSASRSGSPSSRRLRSQEAERWRRATSEPPFWRYPLRRPCFCLCESRGERGNGAVFERHQYPLLASFDSLDLQRQPAALTPTVATLIVADDHPLFRAALREAISRLLPGTTIIEAGSLGSLEQAVQAHPSADLILLDLRMPGA